jgi:hypothetical protein
MIPHDSGSMNYYRYGHYDVTEWTGRTVEASGLTVRVNSVLEIGNVN